MKFCKDCVYFSDSRVGYIEKCWAPLNTRVNLVDGSRYTVYQPATMRCSKATENTCGSEGTWWIQRVQEESFAPPPVLSPPAKKPWYKFWS